MQPFVDFLMWFNNKHVVSTMEALQKKYEFYHNKVTDRLEFGCTLPKLANICWDKSTDSNVYLFTETDKDLLEKIQEERVGEPSIVFTLQTIVDETFKRNSRNLSKPFVGIVASQLSALSLLNVSANAYWFI